MKPMLDPTRDLAGATPEKLAKALFRRTGPLRPGTRRKPVVGDEVPVEEVAPDEAGAVSLIWTRVSDSRTLCLPANSET